MRNVMIDLETMGTGTRAAIVAIGAVDFEPGRPEIGREFYRRIDLVDAVKAGLVIDPETVIWWLSQSNTARVEITRGDRCSLGDGLRLLREWLPENPIVWGYGSIFDIRILEEACACVGLPIPWNYRDIRDVRTWLDLFPPGPRLKRTGTIHHALEDAKHQVRLMAAGRTP